MPNLPEPEKPALTLRGTVDKILPANNIGPEKAQISVSDAEHLYKEIRVPNILQDENGNKVGLKLGAHVEVTIEAEKESTVPKNRP